MKKRRKLKAHKNKARKKIKRKNKLLNIVRDPMFKMRVVKDRTKYNRKEQMKLDDWQSIKVA